MLEKSIDFTFIFYIPRGSLSHILEVVLMGFSLILSNIEDICTVKSIVKNLARDSDLYIFRWI